MYKGETFGDLGMFEYGKRTVIKFKFKFYFILLNIIIIL